jgi:hypothetical protein
VAAALLSTAWSLPRSRRSREGCTGCGTPGEEVCKVVGSLGGLLRRLMADGGAPGAGGSGRPHSDDLLREKKGETV